MSKNPFRRNLMFSVLSADVACKQDEAAQTPRSLLQGCRAARPCNSRVVLDMDFSSFGCETRKPPEQHLCIAELEASRPSQLKIAVDGLHQHGATSSAHGW